MKSPAHLATRPAFFVEGGRSRPKVAIRCSRCAESEVGSDKPGAPAALLAKHFTSAGWKVYREGVSATCPKCQAREAAPSEQAPADIEAALERQRATEARRLASIPAPTPATIAPENMTQPGISTTTIKAQARLHHLLSERFTGDGSIGAYDEGWTDQRIATETGLSITEVVRVREAAYGRVSDPRIAALEKALADERTRAGKELHDLATMLEHLREDHAGRMAALGRQLADLKGPR